jgi:hypothetical protein
MTAVRCSPCVAYAHQAAGDDQKAATALWEALDVAEEHGFDDRLEWVFRTIAQFLPEELNEIASTLWRPLPEWAVLDWWQDPAWDERFEWLITECGDPSDTSSQALRAAIPLARQALARIGGGSTQQVS